MNRQRIKALRGEWGDRYQRVGNENTVLLRDIAKTREYKNDYFELQEERVGKLNLSARNGPAIREAMLGAIARQRAAFGKWDAAAADAESRIYEIMGELANVNELMQFLEDGAVFDRQQQTLRLRACDNITHKCEPGDSRLPQARMQYDHHRYGYTGTGPGKDAERVCLLTPALLPRMGARRVRA